MAGDRFYFPTRDSMQRLINRWDMLLILVIFSVIFFLSMAAKQMAMPYELGKPIVISLSPTYLPWYALKTVLRLFIALCFSLVFTFTVGTLAAKNRKAEQLIIPAIDILQSVPVLSFLSITIAGFIRLFPNSLLGPECASIFVIFTAQVWNMTFGFYQSLKAVPADLKEASAMFQLSAWQRFWKVEVPFSMSSLIWNMMVSMSASWFFVVLSEAISVAHQSIRLPGVGSYIAVAIEHKDLWAVFYAIITMTIVIFLYDQILFRPLIVWSEKFSLQQTPQEEVYTSVLVDWARRSQLSSRIGGYLARVRQVFINGRWVRGTQKTIISSMPHKQRTWDVFWYILLGLFVVGSFYELWGFIFHSLSLHEVVKTLGLGAITALRVIVLIILSSLIWVPIGVYIGLRPALAQKLQPIIQFVAAFPANLFYPLFVVTIVHFHLNVEIGLTPLMILGTQWYILFNVIGGTTMLPRELYLAADNLGVKGMLWWKRLALPAIFPFYITGAISAAGGAWNASIVAEWVNWGDTTLKATGLGAYIQAATLSGDFPKIALGTVMMCLYVLAFNQFLWRPLYRLAEERFQSY